jgi:hypothetical protein
MDKDHYLINEIFELSNSKFSIRKVDDEKDYGNFASLFEFIDDTWKRVSTTIVLIETKTKDIFKFKLVSQSNLGHLFRHYLSRISCDCSNCKLKEESVK